MSFSPLAKKVIIETIGILFILLFIYAAVNKVLDFGNFQAQLGQSPLLSAFAGIVSWLIPIIEFGIVILFFITHYRVIAFFASFSLMCMFSAYIIIILNFSPFIPCSCGGILDKMSWTEHLVFNLAFVCLGATGVFLTRRNPSTAALPRLNTISALVITMFCSIAVVLMLFLLSEDMIQHRNNFVRRFPHHPAVLRKTIDLKVNSYYIAGADRSNVYLANQTAPLSVTVIDSALLRKDVSIIQLPHVGLNFRSFKITVAPPYFYLTDGTQPFILKGSISDWKASVWVTGKHYFNGFTPMNDHRVAIRAIDGSSGQNIIGTISNAEKLEVKLIRDLISAKNEDLFITDGMLLYNSQIDKLIYTYYYKNEFVVANPDLSFHHLGHTIDTATGHHLKVASINSEGQRKLASPAQTSNKRTATHGNYLFVNSALIGKYENREMWDVASIVDVYDIPKKSYAFSFYINNIAGKKMTQFSIQGHRVYAIVGQHLAVYDINTYNYHVDINN